MEIKIISKLARKVRKKSNTAAKLGRGTWAARREGVDGHGICGCTRCKSLHDGCTGTDLLDAVAVVDVDVYVQDTRVVLEQLQDGQDDVVDVAKA